ncbi:MAG TPA: sigma-70 family RNA polymerase sigma factor, partial [Acidimicrobiales bacterium]|nr:sigma-70 family RNA polymerase sigma factor [Acidimicrobiales bacterium]
MKVWINGLLAGEADADRAVSVFDHGLTVGDGVFETLKTYGGRPFAVRRHLDRLAASAAGMGLRGVPPAGVLRAALDEVVAANELDDTALRITVTSGPGPLGSARGGGEPTVVVAPGRLPARADAVDVAVVPWPRNDRGALAGLKTTSYGENVVALAWARDHGAGEAVFANLAGDLCEGTGSNVVVAAGPSPLLRLQSDERLIALVRRGNNAAFETLVSRYQSRLLAFCRHMLGSREDAEDVLQEVFAASFNAIVADDRPIHVRPWLYRIARNRSLNHLRRVQPIGVDSMDIHMSEAGLSTADKVHKREDFRLLVADVQDLPETQKTALLLREIDALSYEQIAEAMETTI